MRSTLLLGGLLASVMIVPVLAQQSPAPAPAAPPPAATPAPTPAPATRAQTTTTAPMATTGQWRASKLIGLNVYNDQNEKLGDINEILLDQTGKATGVVIGVGGFLGLGQHEIQVTMDKLKFVNEPVRTTTTTTTTPATTAAGDRATTSTTAPARPVRATNEKWYPDHAIMSGATKDSLKSMPEFKYN
jgi:sporulation protein YlmC with PRC-barrel domain